MSTLLEQLKFSKLVLDLREPPVNVLRLMAADAIECLADKLTDAEANVAELQAELERRQTFDLYRADLKVVSENQAKEIEQLKEKLDRLPVDWDTEIEAAFEALNVCKSELEECRKKVDDHNNYREQRIEEEVLRRCTVFRDENERLRKRVTELEKVSEPVGWGREEIDNND